jgi:hypothetical protein
MVTKSTKRKFYIFSFSVLGLLMSLVVYGLVSLVILNKSYQVDLKIYFWIMIIAGFLAGYSEGQRWWHIIYIEKAYLKWPKQKLETKLLGLIVLIILTIAVLFTSNNYNL